MGCCQRNEEYRCRNCGCSMQITEEPEHGKEAREAHCPNCGSALESRSSQSGSRAASAAAERPR